MSSTRLIVVQLQLGGEMPFLGELRVVERRVRRFEIGAAVLPVGIEEERIEPAVEIVMMRDVAARALARIELAEPAAGIAQQPLRPRPLRGFDTLRQAGSASTSAIEPCSTTSVPSI